MEYPVSRRLQEPLDSLASYVARHTCIRDSRALCDDSAQRMASLCFYHSVAVNARSKTRADTDDQLRVVHRRPCISFGKNGVNNDLRFKELYYLRLRISQHRDHSLCQAFLYFIYTVSPFGLYIFYFSTAKTDGFRKSHRPAHRQRHRQLRHDHIDL